MEAFDDTVIPPDLSDVWAAGRHCPAMCLAVTFTRSGRLTNHTCCASRADTAGVSSTANYIPSIHCYVTAARRGSNRWKCLTTRSFHPASATCGSRRYGSFYRAVPLPAAAHEADVHASYQDGILEVRVPYAPTPEPKRHHIRIKRK
jgi:Hsp20/alpha crystallin family